MQKEKMHWINVYATTVIIYYHVNSLYYWACHQYIYKINKNKLYSSYPFSLDSTYNMFTTRECIQIKMVNQKNYNKKYLNYYEQICWQDGH